MHATRVKVHLDETCSTHRLITTKPCKSSSWAAKVTSAVMKQHPDNSNVWSFGAATKKAGIIQWSSIERYIHSIKESSLQMYARLIHYNIVMQHKTVSMRHCQHYNCSYRIAGHFVERKAAQPQKFLPYSTLPCAAN